mgnify:CR=1 FL=1
MSKTVRIILVFVLFVLLFLVRAYEMQLFYDPLIDYFQNDYLYRSIPEINSWHLVVDMLYRYSINSVISLGIIHLIFQNKKNLKFSGFLIILLPAFYYHKKSISKKN